ncbi:hypothetical protein [Dyadobacter fanqingshengii]|uniref:Uncharacterized protein n=1 Tax=Dyadobacter fanqingshengii TaxID=2906443 RepID=A0A9X1PCU8_9BACT|nr:hypothetical protein [Dyadobacter fanqingshengii]MCF0041220.1 hypothetical protein [Dyadobacter fanqingshengii]USJ37055.1 hypothetical protein NFI81_04600 [Dyadobacter fanqingshengii]
MEGEIIQSFFNKSDDEISHGITIVGNKNRRVVKKRLAGRGGFRIYFFAYIVDSKVYLSYVYPKTGPQGKASLSKQFETMLISETADAIIADQLFLMSVKDGKLHFK